MVIGISHRIIIQVVLIYEIRIQEDEDQQVVQLETQLVINGLMCVLDVLLLVLILIHVLHEQAVVIQVKLVV